jgi:hypothetical protein
MTNKQMPKGLFVIRREALERAVIFQDSRGDLWKNYSGR